MHVCVLVAHSCLSLCDSVACQAPLSMEFTRQEYWSALSCPSPEDLPDPGIEPGSPTLQADSLPFELPRKTICMPNNTYTDLCVAFLYLFLYSLHICIYIYIYICLYTTVFHMYIRHMYMHADIPIHIDMDKYAFSIYLYIYIIDMCYRYRYILLVLFLLWTLIIAFGTNNDDTGTES